MTTFADGLPRWETCEHDVNIDKDYKDLELKVTHEFGLYQQIDVCNKCGLVIKYTKYKWMPVSRELIPNE